jgi:hypothetical protein
MHLAAPIESKWSERQLKRSCRGERALLIQMPASNAAAALLLLPTATRKRSRQQTNSPPPSPVPGWEAGPPAR